MPEPLVSILINNYNYGRYLSAAIESALTQTYRHVEDIVVDDGSTDDSREVITSFAGRVVSVLKINGGQPSAYNSGFNASRGDIICFLDADDWFYPRKPQELSKRLPTGSMAGSSTCCRRMEMTGPLRTLAFARETGITAPKWLLGMDFRPCRLPVLSMFPARIAGTNSSNAGTDQGRQRGHQ